MSWRSAAAVALSPPTLLHGGGSEGPLSWLLLAAAEVTAVLFGLSLVVAYRRRSRRYLLVSATLAALLSRSVVGLLTVCGLLSAGSHHLLEHGLDAVIAILLLAAVYDSTTTRATERRPNT
jgi:peptidoglycan/LPS O-acetylase OafA/YrhL